MDKKLKMLGYTRKILPRIDKEVKVDKKLREEFQKKSSNSVENGGFLSTTS